MTIDDVAVSIAIGPEMRPCYRELQDFSTIQAQKRIGTRKHLLQNLFQKAKESYFTVITHDPVQA